jgi:TatD DNase family protein
VTELVVRARGLARSVVPNDVPVTGGGYPHCTDHLETNIQQPAFPPLRSIPPAQHASAPQTILGGNGKHQQHPTSNIPQIAILLELPWQIAAIVIMSIEDRRRLLRKTQPSTANYCKSKYLFVRFQAVLILGISIAASSALTIHLPNGIRRTSSFLRGRGLALFSTPSFTSLEGMTRSQLSFVDIGANLLDERFTEGVYHGKHRHEPDWNEMLERAHEAGVKHIILTAGTLKESCRALELVRTLRQVNQTTIHFGCTIGVHPTRCSQEFVNNDDKIPPETVLEQLKTLAIDGQADKSVVALGEIGLDYDRLEFCDKETQKLYLEKQLQSMAGPELDHLPLFLHNRNVDLDLLEVLQRDPRRKHGVVHSFDDTLELAQQFMDMGLYIGINGCSLKTQDNLEVVKALPLDKILLETDCPYCTCQEVCCAVEYALLFFPFVIVTSIHSSVSALCPVSHAGEIKNTHAGSDFVQTKWDKKADKKFELGIMVKGRNEPCQIVQVAEVIAGVKGISVEQVAEACYQNSLRLYGWD